MSPLIAEELPVALGFLLLEIIEEDIFTVLFQYNHGFY